MKKVTALVVVIFLSLLSGAPQPVHALTTTNNTFLESGVVKGAVCLDGSPPVYSYIEGDGTGSRSWMIFLQGGGWCSSIDECQGRKYTDLGSSFHMDPQNTFSGIFDTNDSFNPNFYNWHKIFIHYCDGASFIADVEHMVDGLSLRGGRIFKVMMEEMMSKGMRNAENAILMGSSAGGLATLLHCDGFRSLFPLVTRVKCISDSGFFFLEKNFPGADDRAHYYANIIKTHELNKSLPTSCTSKINPNLCLYPENFVGDIKTPVFILELAFDSYKIETTLFNHGGRMAWLNCTTNPTSCNSTQLQILRDFRAIFIETLLKLDHSSSRGMFVHSFYRHSHLLLRNGWTCSAFYGNNILNNKSIGKAISDWYFDRSPFVEINIQQDIPQYSPFSDSDTVNQQCLANISAGSVASTRFVITFSILIAFLSYLL